MHIEQQNIEYSFYLMKRFNDSIQLKQLYVFYRVIIAVETGDRKLIMFAEVYRILS